MATIAIIGAGSVGSSVGRIWAGKGHTIIYGVRDPSSDKVAAVVEATGRNSSTASPAAAANAADVVVLAVPWAAIEDVIASLGDLDGKPLLDATNPLALGPDGLELEIGHSISGAERIAKLAKGASVVKALNQVGAEAMADPGAFPARPVMFVAGDDETAKAIALGLVDDLGFDARDAGALKASRLLEPFAMTWIHLALSQNAGRDWAFSITSRGEGGIER